MATDSKKRRLFKKDQDLFDFAQAYLSEAFPNPDRTGCPPDQVLSILARDPMRGDLSMTDHLTCCSPCFNTYMGHLKQARAQAKESRRFARAVWIKRSLVSASVAILLVLMVYTLSTKRQSGPSMSQKNPVVSNPGTSAPTPAESLSVPVLLDLSTATPGRGREGKSERSLPRIPAQARIELTLRLPIGSEAAKYSVRLTSKQHTEWSSTALAHLDAGQPVLNMHADFSQIPDGTYDLVVSSRGLRLDMPVLITSLSNKER